MNSNVPTPYLMCGDIWRGDAGYPCILTEGHPENQYNEAQDSHVDQNGETW
jgi:hypothetical protein